MPANHQPPAYSRHLRPTRLGLVLFLIYVALYAAFVAALLRPSPPDDGTQTGIPYSVIWGLGLIAAAWVLALIYAFGTKVDLALSDGEAK